MVARTTASLTTVRNPDRSTGMTVTPYPLHQRREGRTLSVWRVSAALLSPLSTSHNAAGQPSTDSLLRSLRLRGLSRPACRALPQASVESGALPDAVMVNTLDRFLTPNIAEGH